MRATLAARPTSRPGVLDPHARARDPNLELTGPEEAPVPARRGGIAPTDRPAASEETPSVLRRLERSLDSLGRPAAKTPVEDTTDDIPSGNEGSLADGDLRSQVITLQKQLDLLQRRVEALEKRLMSAGQGDDLPEPRP